ncbi:MAG: hypothetical protein LBL90_08350 [Prevotellaceae bacterium]|jgi:hypothetical protein|nr:hypothetical protein [Prevotellaceae bacterium]
MVLLKNLLNDDLSGNSHPSTYNVGQIASPSQEKDISFLSIIKKKFIQKKFRIISDKSCFLCINGGKKENVQEDILKIINVKDGIVNVEVFSKEYKDVKLYYTVNLNDLGH